MLIAALLSMPAAGGIALSATARSADLPPTHLVVMGSLGGTAQYRDLEEPFWAHQLSADSDGRVTADVTPFDRTGLKAPEALQMARLGVISFLTLPLSLVASEDPEANAMDLPGLNPSLADMQGTLAAYRPILSELYRSRYGLEPLAMMSYPGQVMFCKERFGRLTDLAGRRIRVAGAAQASLVGAIGAHGVVLPLAETQRALAGDLVDCAITGSMTGNALGLARTTHYVHALTINWGLQIVVANHAAWLSLSPDVRKFLADELAALEHRAWDLTERATIQGLSCDAGRDDCTDGTKGDMILVAADPADRVALGEILRTVILPQWATRCGEECVQQWNRTVGAATGLTAAAP
jgi:TRAP-type C4-dicarboxylate transport system substrate-binding protein